MAAENAESAEEKEVKYEVRNPKQIQMTKMQNSKLATDYTDFRIRIRHKGTKKIGHREHREINNNLAAKRHKRHKGKLATDFTDY